MPIESHPNLATSNLFLMKPKSNPFLLSTALATSFAWCLFASSNTNAATSYYWDPDGADIVGFGTASGTWGTDDFWGTDATGSGVTSNPTMTNADDIHFGTDALGLAAGTIVGPATAQEFLNMTFGSASGNITLSGGFLNLDQITGSRITIHNTANTVSTVLQGTDGKLIKSGSGSLTLSAKQAYTGETVVDEGTLILSGGNAPDSGLFSSISITINEGGQILVYGDNALQGYSTTLVAPLTINAGGSMTAANGVTAHIRGTLDLNGGTQASGTPDSQYGTWTLDGDVTASGTITSTISAAQTNWPQTTERSFTVSEAEGVLNVTGTFARPAGFPGVGGPAFTGSLTKAGPGTMILRGANTYTGATTVTEGTLTFAAGGSARSSSSFTVASGSTLECNGVNVFVLNHTIAVDNSRVITVNGGTLMMTGNAEARVGNITLNDGATWTSNRSLGYYDILLADTSTGAATVAVTGNAASLMDGSGGIHLLGMQNFDVADVTENDDADLTVSMILADQLFAAPATGGITKSGTGTMVLSGANTYTGDTQVNAGNLTLDPTGSMRFAPVTNGVSNKITGTGTANLNGTFHLNLTNANLNGGNSWTLVDVATANYALVEITSTPELTFTQAGQLWTAPDGDKTWTFNQSTGKLTLTAPGGYASWANTYANDQTAELDFDNDGVENGIEYFLNTTTAGSTASPSSFTGSIASWTNGGNIPSAAYGTQFYLQASTDLVIWNAVPIGDPNLNNTDGSVSYTLSGTGKQFVRLVVSP